jgi:hypothetical protein
MTVDGGPSAFMKRIDEMSETPQFSEAKRALLEKYLRGDPPKEVKAASTFPQSAKAEMTSHRDRVIAVQTGGSKPPFFYLHGEWRGQTFYCYPLAQALGEGQPFYALEPYTFEGLRLPPSFETIAKAHIELLRSIQPEGPYLLGGWCNGALIAYEMALQLRVQGLAVDLLVLMDANSVVPGKRKLFRSVIDRLCSLMRLGQEAQLDWFLIALHVYRYLRFSHYRQRKNAEHMKNAGLYERDHKPGKIGIAFPRFDVLFTKAEVLRQDYPPVFDWVNADYSPDPYPGKITFFRANEEPKICQGWQKLSTTKEVEIHVIPGNDTTCRTEYLHVLADHLRECLSKAQAAASSRESTRATNYEENI